MTDTKKAAPRQECSPKNTRSKYSKFAKVGGGFAVRFKRRPDGSVECQWSPCVPTAHQLETQVSAFEYQTALLRFVGGAK
ncbi:MAG: hypothetical protein CME38_14935 [Haliea sp.]|nr:hypothetical protein [Haliea sp.]